LANDGSETNKQAKAASNREWVRFMVSAEAGCDFYASGMYRRKGSILESGAPDKAIDGGILTMCALSHPILRFHPRVAPAIGALTTLLGGTNRA
jgi:hypothetical protein